MDLITVLPLEVIEKIVSQCDRASQLELSRTSTAFRHVVNRQLYRHIMLVSLPLEKKGYTTLTLDRLTQFVTTLLPFNFQFIKRIIIHTQLDPLALISYTLLYRKLLTLWDKLPCHQLKVDNYDLNNLRVHQLLNQFIYNHTLSFVIEDLCVDQTHVNYKINNLCNWMIFNYLELGQLPINPNLRELQIFIERSQHQMSRHDEVTPNVIRNFANLQLLYLTTPLATLQFKRYFANYDGPQAFPQLRQLLICNSHSYKDNSLMTYEGIARILPFAQLELLELKLLCTHHDCDCIVQFFNDMPKLEQLKNFMLINTNTKLSQLNMLQFQALLELPLFYDKISNVLSLYLNINELMKLSTNVRTPFSFDKVAKMLAQLPNLQLLCVPDYFNHWVLNLDDYVDKMMNACKCDACDATRRHFGEKARLFSPRLDAPVADADNRRAVVGQSELLVKYLNYIALQAKKQHRFINENLNLINLIITLLEKPVMKDLSLERYKTLFTHNYIGQLVGQLKGDNANMAVTLGGMEF